MTMIVSGSGNEDVFVGEFGKLYQTLLNRAGLITGCIRIFVLEGLLDFGLRGERIRRSSAIDGRQVPVSIKVKLEKQ